MDKGILINPKKLILGPCQVSAEISNPTQAKIDIRLVLAGSPEFSIPEKYRSMTLGPGSFRRIPVNFRIGPTKFGWPIALDAEHRAVVQVWSADPKQKKRLLGVLPVSARGPVLVPFLRCLELAEPKPGEARKGNSPPTIALTVVKPGTDFPKNTGEVELSYNVENADEIGSQFLVPWPEVLEPGQIPESTSGGHAARITPPSDTFTYAAGGSMRFVIFARNADGQTWDAETIYQTVRVGYHRARCPAGGTIYTNELDQIRSFLQDIDGRLRSNQLEQLPDFIEEWNQALDANPEISPEAREYFRLPHFDDMDYLDGAVGTRSLADDILAAMADVLIHIKASTLPRGNRPGTTSARTLCEEWECNPEGDLCGILGKTYYSDSDPDCNWLGICLENGASELTLLHELYHYSTGSDDEKKAWAVSNCAYWNIPF
jgi:hypothetical protein